MRTVFARGFAVDKANIENIDPAQLSHWEKSGELMERFNAAMRKDTRIETLILPIFDGISQIRLLK